MKLSEVIMIISRIMFLETFMRAPTSGHQVAKSFIFTWSRSTTYRKLKKCEKLGLIAYADNGNCHEWVVTPLGRKFRKDYNELPI